MERESKHRMLMTAGTLLTMFAVIHFNSYAQLFAIYGSAFIVLSYLAWQLTKTIKRYLPPRRISPLKKAVFITGCDTGFGYHLARRLYEEGYTVFAGCLSASGDGAKALRSDHSPERMHVLQIDVTKDVDVVAAVQEVKSKLIDGNVLWAIVNNAGIGSVGYAEMETMETYERVIAVNQLGVVRVTRAFLPLIRQSRGRVIVVASILGRLALTHIVPYSMTKHAVVAFCDGLRQELWKWGIRVISVEPSFYRTNIYPSDEATHTLLEKKWNTVDPEVRGFYGEESLKQAIRGTLKMTKFANANISAVLETLVNTVTVEDPDDENLVMPFIHRPFYWLLLNMPTKLRTLILALAERQL